jgi:CPA1 family monovalent cation:H+ antiporter
VVILLSLIGASIGLPPLLRGLELPAEPEALQEEDRARHAAAVAAIEAIDRSQHALTRTAAVADADLYTHAAARVQALYQRRLQGDATGDGEAQQLRKADNAERALRLAALQAERGAIFQLARQRQISDATSRKLVRELDLAEARYR